MRTRPGIGSLWVCLGALGLPAQSEKQPTKPPAWLTKEVRTALKLAERDQQRVLLLAAPKAQLKGLQRALKMRALGRLVRYEYQVVNLPSTALVRGPEGNTEASLAVIQDARSLKATMAWSPATKPAALTAFLTKHQAPRVDAETVFQSALAQAKRTNRRVLVHLGAPW